ncbi:DUF2267 domain-containing protein [Streptomyces sp. NPDC048279]|uniref:DUF2267 domain-containing protein n=1 Tax=Streptomyces sp. NPDC048279 TaxID=3154714 RepID=UPI00343535CF
MVEKVRYEGAHPTRERAEEAIPLVVAGLGRQLTGDEHAEHAARLPSKPHAPSPLGSPTPKPLTGRAFVKDLAARRRSPPGHHPLGHRSRLRRRRRPWPAPTSSPASCASSLPGSRCCSAATNSPPPPERTVPTGTCAFVTVTRTRVAKTPRDSRHGRRAVDTRSPSLAVDRGLVRPGPGLRAAPAPLGRGGGGGCGRVAAGSAAAQDAAPAPRGQRPGQG